MHNVERNVYYVLFLIVCSGIFVNCQGGRGHDGRSRSSSHREFWEQFLLIMAIITGVGGFIFILLCCCCHKKRKGPIRDDNSTFVYSAPCQQYPLVKSVCQTGMWSSRYYQHGFWHGPHQLYLSFNPLSLTIIGSGSDDVGEFTIDGVFSDRTQRMGFTKYYKHWTGNAAKNLGHFVIVQVTFRAELNQFEGKWYVDTTNYQGENEFVVKFDESIV